MAPGFLSKFQRRPSSARAPSPTSEQPPPVPILTVDADAVSINPSVNIGIIPPSPRSTLASTDPSFDDRETQPQGQTLQHRRRASNASSQRDLSFSVDPPQDRHSRSRAASSAAYDDDYDDALPTPVPRSNQRNRDQTQTVFSAAKPASRTASAKSSRSNLRESVPDTTTTDTHTTTTTTSNDTSTDKSMHSAADLSRRSSVSHGRAATSPGPRYASPEPDEMGILAGAPLSDSPTRLTHTANGSSERPAPVPFHPPAASSTFSTPATNSTFSTATTGSNFTAASGKSGKSGWRKPSLGAQSRKPTGLASAIAASGLAMANPTMSAQHIAHTQMQTPISIAPTPAPRKASGDYATNANANGNGNGNGGGKSRHAASASVSSVAQPATLDPPRTRTRAASTASRASYDSGLDNWSDNSDESGSEDGLDLDLREDMDIPVTGFAVASNKRNADFHELFPTIPEGDYLIEDYGCALQREILIQGRIYISENHICFHANIFGWITDLSIPIYEITALEKKMTAFVIPNAIQLTTRQAKYQFASFLSRDTTFDVIHNIWRLARPDDAAGGGGSARGSLDAVRAGMDERRASTEAVGAGGSATAAGGIARRVSAGGPRGGKILENKVTQCTCGKRGEHYSETALDTTVPGTPDKIYSLVFASGFIKEFMKGEQKLLDLQISDWAPTAPGSKLLARNMSYIKPLYASLGPKQTKCEIRDETVFCDFDDHVVVVTTTRTPDVPSGGVFAVKTRTCLTWASAASTRILVTTQVEWTGRSFIKSIIESSAIAGQKTYHADLDAAMRAYIQAHQSEFVPEGVEALAVAPVEPTTAAAPAGPAVVDAKEREKERNQRSLQWAYDTFEGAYTVAKRSTAGALELISDAWDQSTSTTILIFVIVVLVFSNLFTLTKLGQREDVGRRKEMQKTAEKEKWVQGIVTALWDELAVGKAGAPGISQGTSEPLTGANWRDEFANINRTLNEVEDRIRRIRETLDALD
ncbi:hypothetical protein HWV62_1915 [Athelia sp. TMB]|nr:hypothetical protein HWV62_1915 [Athelia sp. TMB]